MMKGFALIVLPAVPFFEGGALRRLDFLFSFSYLSGLKTSRPDEFIGPAVVKPV
jgi:hypothetical protein